MSDVAVIGAGSWGTALARHLVEIGHATTLWAREPEVAASINEAHENRLFLPGIALPPSLRATCDLAEAVGGREVLLCVVPSHGVREVFGRVAEHAAAGALIVSATKGIEDGTLQTMEEVLKDVLPGRLGGRIVVLSGPSFAREVASGLPTAVVVAGRDRQATLRAQEILAGERLRIYTSDDVVGVEIGGALKNVMAIAAGVVDGFGFGANARAAIITRGLAEITRLAVRRGANPMTLAGLAGMGDLVLTCTGDLSRNRTVGVLLGKGRAIGDILGEMSMVAEGVRTARAAHQLADRIGVEMPITAMVSQVLHEGKPAIEAVVELLARPMKHELG